MQRLDGSTEAIRVRLLKISEFPDYLRLVDDEPTLADFLMAGTSSVP